MVDLSRWWFLSFSFAFINIILLFFVQKIQKGWGPCGVDEPITWFKICCEILYTPFELVDSTASLNFFRPSFNWALLSRAQPEIVEPFSHWAWESDLTLFWGCAWNGVNGHCSYKLKSPVLSVNITKEI